MRYSLTEELRQAGENARHKLADANRRSAKLARFVHCPAIDP